MFRTMRYAYFLCLILLVVSSCASKEDLFYLQDGYENNVAEIEYQNLTIQPNDILKINVETIVPEAARPYNLGIGAEGGMVPNLLLLQLEGYLVSKEGTIDYPVLGKVKVMNLTVAEISELIREKLVNGGHLNDPTVSVRIINSKVTVLGEVRQPGTFSFTEPNISLFQALGYAGDLTINGKRDDIIVTREVGGSRKIAHVDITNTEFMSSEFYFLKPNDVIIVNPNKPRVTSSGYIGDIGAVLAVSSLLLTSVILLSR